MQYFDSPLSPGLPWTQLWPGFEAQGLAGAHCSRCGHGLLEAMSSLGAGQAQRWDSEQWQLLAKEHNFTRASENRIG